VKAIDYRHMQPLTLCNQDVQYFEAMGTDESLSDILVFTGESMEILPMKDILEKFQKTSFEL